MNAEARERIEKEFDEKFTHPDYVMDCNDESLNREIKRFVLSTISREVEAARKDAVLGYDDVLFGRNRLEPILLDDFIRALERRKSALSNLGIPEARKPRGCKWEQDEDGNYNTSCGGSYAIVEGTPAENEMKYCPFCGEALIEMPFAESR